MNTLETLLGTVKTDLEAALRSAEQELAELDDRRDLLIAQIEEARRLLGTPPATRTAVDVQITLHEAIELVLDENGNRWMTARELADEINTRGLYRKRDGSPVETNQVHARTKNYESRFEKDNGRIRRRGV